MWERHRREKEEQRGKRLWRNAGVVKERWKEKRRKRLLFKEGVSTRFPVTF